jgi:hypothetical protein
MFRIDPRPLLTLTVIAALLAVAGAAHASSVSPPGGIVTDNKDPDKLLRGHRDAALVFSGDAYDNEMGITDARGVGVVLMADMGGQMVGSGTATAGLNSHTKPSADGIIAVLTGLNHTDRGFGVAGDGSGVTGVVAAQTDPRSSVVAGTGSGPAGPPPSGAVAPTGSL